MSDTPRTDAEFVEAQDLPKSSYVVPLHLARQLERESQDYLRRFREHQCLLNGALQLLSEAGKMPSSTELIAAAERAERRKP